MCASLKFRLYMPVWYHPIVTTHRYTSLQLYFGIIKTTFALILYHRTPERVRIALSLKNTSVDRNVEEASAEAWESVPPRELRQRDRCGMSASEKKMSELFHLFGFSRKRLIVLQTVTIKKSKESRWSADDTRRVVHVSQIIVSLFFTL